MKFKNNQDFSFLGYLHTTWYDKNQTDELEIHPTFEQFNQFSEPVMDLMPIFFVLDYTCKKYTIFTESIKHILGYDARELLEGGWGLTFHLVQKDFFKVYDQKVFPATMAFLRRIPQPEHQNYIFSYNCQYRNHEGKYINTLQRSRFITSKDTGLPLYCYGMIMDISPYKRDTVVVQTVEKKNAETHAFQIVETNYFYPFEEDALLTRQETNIIKYMADGLSSKMIAYKLGISENTIANHRKNMLRKTNTKNVAQLIAFVIRNGMI